MLETSLLEAKLNMKWNLLKNNLKPIQKICLTGLFIALAMVLQKVLAINYIPIVPFLRISLGGPAIIIFSSIFLGPLYGLVVGVASDVIGYFLLDPKMMGFLPQISAIYGVLGLLSCFIFFIFRYIKNEKMVIIFEGMTFLGILIGITLFLCLNTNLHLYSATYHLEVWQKILIPSLMFLLLAALFVTTIILNKELKNDELPMNPINISFSCFVIELLIMVMFGTIMKGWAFGFNTYPMILICQLIVLFINVPLNTWLITLFLKLTKRFYN